MEKEIILDLGCGTSKGEKEDPYGGYPLALALDLREEKKGSVYREIFDRFIDGKAIYVLLDMQDVKKAKKETAEWLKETTGRGKGVVAIRADYHRLPFKAGSIDKIVLRTPYTRDREALPKIVRDTLKPEGKLYEYGMPEILDHPDLYKLLSEQSAYSHIQRVYRKK